MGEIKTSCEYNWLFPLIMEQRMTMHDCNNNNNGDGFANQWRWKLCYKMIII